MIRGAEREIVVRCRSETRYDDEPTAVVRDGVEITVTAIEDRWYEGGRTAGRPTIHYFKLRLATREVLIVGYDAEKDRWFSVS